YTRADLPLLHSFPTRRSSDLSSEQSSASLCNCGARDLSARARSTCTDATAVTRLSKKFLRGCRRTTLSARSRSPRCAVAAALARSEEHTSELQSLAYLVCRLL